MPVPDATVDGEKMPYLHIGKSPDENIDARSLSTPLKSKKNEFVSAYRYFV
jgi:hypothetical protein